MEINIEFKECIKSAIFYRTPEPKALSIFRVSVLSPSLSYSGGWNGAGIEGKGTAILPQSHKKIEGSFYLGLLHGNSKIWNLRAGFLTSGIFCLGSSNGPFLVESKNEEHSAIINFIDSRNATYSEIGQQEQIKLYFTDGNWVPKFGGGFYINIFNGRKIQAQRWDFFRAQDSIVYFPRGSVFRGPAYGDSPSGAGEYQYVDGSTFKGVMDIRGLPIGNHDQFIHPDLFIKYRILHGQNGSYLLEYPCGSIYEGNIMNGNPHGVGEIRFCKQLNIESITTDFSYGMLKDSKGLIKPQTMELIRELGSSSISHCIPRKPKESIPILEEFTYGCKVLESGEYFRLSAGPKSKERNVFTGSGVQFDRRTKTLTTGSPPNSHSISAPILSNANAATAYPINLIF